MTSAWAQRQEAWLRDCIVSPDVFASIVDRLCTFVVPYESAKFWGDPLQAKGWQRTLCV